MTIATLTYDTADHLDGPELIAAYLEAVFEDGDAALISAAIGDVARAQGMTQIAARTGLSRESLYRALSLAGHPEFATVLKVLKSFGVRLALAPIDSAPAAKPKRGSRAPKQSATAEPVE